MPRGEPGLENPMGVFVERYMHDEANRRLHMTCEDLSLNTLKHIPQRAEYSLKPTGLWYGIDNSWIDWCISEQMSWICPNIYEVILNEERLLKIDNIPDFEKFENEYGDVPPWENHYWSAIFENRKERINYEAVIQKYGGLEISPYQYRKRMKSFWYYGWDCASGIIWDHTMVKDLRPFAFYDRQKNEYIKI